MDEPRVGETAEIGETVRQNGVDRYGDQRVIRGSELLDDANAVDHRGRPDAAKQPRQRVGILGVYAPYDALTVRAREIARNHTGSGGAEGLEVRARA